MDGKGSQGVGLVVNSALQEIQVERHHEPVHTWSTSSFWRSRGSAGLRPMLPRATERREWLLRRVLSGPAAAGALATAPPSTWQTRCTAVDIRSMRYAGTFGCRHALVHA